MKTERVLEIAKELKKLGKELQNKEKRFLFALDPKISRRVLHIKRGSYAISVITGHTFKLPKKYLIESLNKILKGNQNE